MRILYCTNSIGARGGIERVTIVKANALAEIDGVDVAICYTDAGTYPASTIHPLSPKVKTFDLRVPFWDLTPLNLRNLAVTAPRKFLALRNALKQLIRDYDPDVVVTTGSYEKFALASLRLPKGKIKIREYHFNSRYRQIVGNSMLLRFAGYIDNHLLSKCFDCNYLLTKEDLANFKGARNFDYKYNPCSFEGAGPLPQHREKVVIVVGRLVELKNVAAILRIWSRVVEKAQDWQLWIVGDGDERQRLEGLSSQLGIEGSVCFWGFTDDVRGLLCRARILAMASKCEGFGVNIIEAMGCGVVPISYATPYGPRDIISDGVDGVLVEYMNEGMFAERLMSLLSDTAAVDRMSRAAVARARDFAPHKVAQEWLKELTQRVALRSKRASRDVKGKK